MKRNKKLIMALSFCVGVALFGTTVFADISTKTGYDELKDSVKNSLKSYSEDVKNFTLETSMIMKDNDKVISTINSTVKYDNENKRTEDSTASQTASGKIQNTYTYRDLDCSIWYNPQDKTYYLTEYTNKNDFTPLDNPFKEERVKDMEKIADALVGNLKDYVVVETKPDGGKELSGSLNETQIPALVNAISSFFFKQSFTDRNNEELQVPQIKDDIFIKSVTGKAIVNKDGLIESLLATGILTGKDKQGVSHDVSAEVLFKFVDVNTTVLSRPDLTGKVVQKGTETPVTDKAVSTKFVGKYKNDIVIEENNQFVKVGERYIEIAHIDGKNVAGRYYEVYKDQYKQKYADKQIEFTFDAVSRDSNSATFEYKDKGYNLTEIYFDPQGARINLGGSTPGYFDYSFSRVFDN